MRNDTLWFIRLWNEWTKERNSRTEEPIPLDITTVFTDCAATFAVPLCVGSENWKKDGTPYPLDSLYHLVCGITRFIRQNGKPEIDFFKEAACAEFRATFLMLNWKQAGNGSRKRKAEPLTQEEEELLWVKSILGIILHKHFWTVFSSSTIYVSLRTVVMSIIACGTMIHKYRLLKNPEKHACLVYTEDSSKNNQGGLKGHKRTSKQVVHHENTDNPARCPVWLFKMYTSLCSKDCPANAF